MTKSELDQQRVRNGLSRRTCIAYFLAFFAMIALALYRNRPCLFFDWDGVVWAVVMEYFEEFSRPFAIAMVDPLQGMFDVYYLAYRGALPHILLGNILGIPLDQRFSTHLFYAVALVVSSYAAGRAIGFRRTETILGSFLVAILTLPLFSEVGALDILSNLSPHATYCIAATTGAVACIWAIDGNSLPKTIALCLCIVLIVASVAWSFVLTLPYVVIVFAGLTLPSLLIRENPAARVARLIVIFLVVATVSILGFPNYLLDLGSNIAYVAFHDELGIEPLIREQIGSPGLTNWILTLLSPSKAWIADVGFVGAAILLLTTPNPKLRWFSFGYIGLFAVFLFGTIATLRDWESLTGQPYYGPTLYRLAHFLSPFGAIYLARFVLLAIHCLLSAIFKIGSTELRSNRPSDWDQAHRISRLLPLRDRQAFSSRLTVHGALMVALLLPAALALINNPGPGQQRCTRPYFFPLERNAIVDYLAPRVAISVGSNYNGSVATFTGKRNQDLPLWINNLTTDHQLWIYSGNDMRLLGLWQYRIPTLAQANITTTPQYFLTLGAFLTHPNDKQMATFFSFSEPNPKMMGLWGVRFVIADHTLPFGIERTEMPVALTNPPLYDSPIRVYELEEPNLGNFSPTEIITAANATEMIAYMKDPRFDPRRTVITEHPIDGSLVAARGGTMSIIKGGLIVEAEGGPQSLLVLPVQFSHCWTTSEKGVKLFRANLLQLGVQFSSRLSSKIEFVFGPLWNSSCRREDSRDVERLRMRDARKAFLSGKL